jgi:nucleoid DNA-binding protein
MSVTKFDIVQRIAKESGLEAVRVRQVVQLLLDGMIEALANGGRLEWREFGVFKTRVRKARKARNPRTGEKVVVPEKKVVGFKAGKTMGERVRGGEQRQPPAT